MASHEKQARVPEAADVYDSGVSNGDVDWLFRGKSKKLTKKMNLNKDIDKEKEKDQNSASNDTQLGTNAEPKLPKLPRSKKSVPQASDSKDAPQFPSSNEPIKGSRDAKSQNTQNDPSAASVPADTKESKPEAQSSKMDKLFRTRSSSLSKTDKKDKSRDKVFNLLNYSGTSFDGTSEFNQQMYLEISQIGSSSLGPPMSKETSTSKPRSRSSSVGLNSSTGKEKRSLFSSLSSKFKSGSSPSTPSSGSAPASSASSDAQTNDHLKWNPNTLTFGGSSVKDDFSSLYNKQPPELAGMGIPIKRKNSIQEQAGSVEKLSSSAGSFNSFFKRRTSTSSNTSLVNTCSERQRRVLNKNPNKQKVPIKELSGVTLKRVNFSIDKLIYDPQQQIPSRRPRKGNVLIPEDLTAPIPRLSQGISLSDGSNGSKNEKPKYSEKELSMAVEAQKRALIEADKHAQEAHISAKRIALEVSQYKPKSKGNPDIKSEISDDEEETEAKEGTFALSNEDAKHIEIDKPLHLHEQHFEEDTVQADISNLTLEQIYTRCCHLREILPIPATLKQLKNKSKPLSVLKLLNPKPTLIDVLSFSDFIAMVPITTVIFDNVTMTTEMLKHLLASLAYNKSLEKLSLRNVPIDELGWKYLCKFLSRNQSVKKLDISQQRIKSDLSITSARSHMNWKLFIKAVVMRGGLEELVINGCKLTDEVFEELITKAVANSTYRLGIASCELNHYKTQVVCNWLKNPASKCVGVDVAFNDLSGGQLRYFIDCFNSGNVNLIFFSLYQTNLSNVEETTELLKSLTKVKTLRFLDLSSLPSLFPSIISRLNVYLPKMENIKRLHFDLNDLTSQSIIALSEILPKINGLVHVSLLGNRNINNSVAASVYASVKKSRSIHTLDLDYDLINDKLNQRIAFYLMRNMDNIINLNDQSSKGDLSNHPKDQEAEELMFDGSLLMESAEKLLIEAENKSDKSEDIKLNKLISNALIERTRELRQSIHKTIDTLFDQRNSGTLSLEGKESLLRFCLLDASLEKLVHIFEEQANKSGAVGMSPSPSIDLDDETSPIKPIAATKSLSSKKDHPIIDLGDKELLHQSSSELITSGPILSPRNTETLNKLGYFQPTGESSTFQPHQVVVESNSEGKTVPIDYLTGRPVLMRSISQTSSHAKEQELEEGEFHRWGFFIQQRNNSSNNLAGENKDKEKEKADPKPIPTLNVLPSGNELREAIIEAKGIESITDLIDKINNNRVSLEKIYSVADKEQQAEIEKQLEALKLEEEKKRKELANDVESIDSMEGDHEVDAVVDEVYEKLLNDAERVRSNK